MKLDENKTVVVEKAEAEVLARACVDLLDDRAQHLNAVALQKLANARTQAVSHLAAQQTGGVNQSGNVLQWLGGGHFWQHKVMAISLLFCAILLTFLVAQRLNNNNNQRSTVVGYVENSDAFLLASELPPEAFADKGFDTWVVSKQN